MLINEDVSNVCWHLNSCSHTDTVYVFHLFISRQEADQKHRSIIHGDTIKYAVARCSFVFLTNIHKLLITINSYAILLVCITLFHTWQGRRREPSVKTLHSNFHLIFAKFRILRVER